MFLRTVPNTWIGHNLRLPSWTERGKLSIYPSTLNCFLIKIINSTSATEIKSMLAPSTTFKSTRSNKKTHENPWSLNTSIAWWAECSPTNLMVNLLVVVQKMWWLKLTIQLKLAPTQLRAANTWNKWEKQPSSSCNHWRTSQPSPSANPSIQTFRLNLWLTFPAPFVRTSQSLNHPCAELTHQPLPFLVALSPQSLHWSLHSLAWCNHVHIPHFWN